MNIEIGDFVTVEVDGEIYKTLYKGHTPAGDYFFETEDGLKIRKSRHGDSIISPINKASKGIRKM